MGMLQTRGQFSLIGQAAIKTSLSIGGNIQFRKILEKHVPSTELHVAAHLCLY